VFLGDPELCTDPDMGPDRLWESVLILCLRDSWDGETQQISRFNVTRWANMGDL